MATTDEVRADLDFMWAYCLGSPGVFWYLATPYSKYADGLEAAFIEAAKATAFFVKNGVRVYSPIAHTHPVAVHGGLDPLDHAIWLPADRPFMETAYGLVVVKMPGWDASYGIGEEIKVFTAARKPVFHFPWPLQSEDRT